MVFNATFNNISVISWRSVLLVEETGVPRENHRPVTDKLYHIMLFRTGFEVTTLVVIGTDCTGSCKSNYHMITTTTTPPYMIQIQDKNCVVDVCLAGFHLLQTNSHFFQKQMKCHYLIGQLFSVLVPMKQ